MAATLSWISSIFGEDQTGDHGSEGGDDLVDEREQGAHQAGNVLTGAVGLVVGAVGSHGDDDVAGEQGTLLGIVGDAGLSGLGDDTLAGVANIVRSRHDDEENQADVALGQHVGHMEQDERSDAQKPPD